MLDLPALKIELIAKAKHLGFSHLGVAQVRPAPHYPEFEAWVKAGHHATMGYLSRPDTLAKREDPNLVLEGCQSVISLAFPYQPHGVSLKLAPNGYGKISSYAQIPDYHETIMNKLNQLVDFILTKVGTGASLKAYVDTGPILERGFAARAGLGMPGKNSCLIIPRHGSYYFLAEILTDLPLPVDPPFTQDLCGSCRRCIEACPTGCILEDGTIDAGRCISYLTIENKVEISNELKKDIRDWFFGCDVCQAVCPHNARLHKQISSTADTILPEFIDLISILTLDENTFHEVFKETPLMRAKRGGLIRNAAVVLGNQKHHPALPLLENLAQDEREVPVVRETCNWAIQKINQVQN